MLAFRRSPLYTAPCPGRVPNSYPACRMSLRTVCAAAVAAAVLVAVPACKKKKTEPTDSAPNNPQPTPPPNPGTTPQSGDPNAPRTPVFAGGHPLLTAIREDAQQQLKQIGLAIHAHHDATSAFPTAIVDNTGKPLLSWRVAILPYLGHDNLYRQFKLNEPWDSTHNKALVQQMPKQYAPPRTDTFGYTFYRGFSGPGTWLPPSNGPRPQATRFTSFTDGLSNTILVAEAAEAVVWTKPDEIAFDPLKSVPAIGGVFATGTNVLFADGSVRFLRKGLDAATLSKLIQIADGGIVMLD